MGEVGLLHLWTGFNLHLPLQDIRGRGFNQTSARAVPDQQPRTGRGTEQVLDLDVNNPETKSVCHWRSRP